MNSRKKKKKKESEDYPFCFLPSLEEDLQKDKLGYSKRTIKDKLGYWYEKDIKGGR